MHTLLLIAFLQAPPSGEPLRSGCSVDTDQIATVGPGDQVRVLLGVAGEDRPCHKVTLIRPSENLTGYVLGDALPAVREFQRQREKASEDAAEAQSRSALTEGATAPKAGESEADKPKDPLISRQFDDFAGRDSKGERISLSGLKGRVTIVSFWSPKGAQGRRQVMSLMPLYNQFHSDGLAAVGVSMDPNPSHILEALDDVTPNWPQMPDGAGLAAHYNVDPRAGKVFVLDSSHRIVAAGQMGPEIEKAVRQLLSSP